MGSIIMPGQASPPPPSALDIVYKIIFESGGGKHSSPFETLDFKPAKGGLSVSVAGKPDRASLIKLFGNMARPDYYWDVSSGKLDYGDVKPAGFYALARYSPDTALLSMLDILDAGREFQYSGAGKGTVENAPREEYRAYGAGHETVLRSLMSVPAIANMVKGLDPSNGKKDTAAAHIVQNVLRAHKKNFGYGYKISDSKGKKVAHNTAFETLPKLMSFLVSVNEKFDEKMGDNNPLIGLLSSDLLDPSVLDKGGNCGQMRFLLRRNEGESDEDFYSRQLEDINRYRVNERGTPEMSYEQYYNWIIDRMVRNIANAAKALAGREAEINAERSKGLRLIRTGDSESLAGLRKQLAGLREKIKYSRAYLIGAGHRKDWLERRISEVDAAMSVAAQWEKETSLEDRKAALAARRDKAEAMLEDVRGQYAPYTRLADARSSANHIGQLLSGETTRYNGRVDARDKRIRELEEKLNGLVQQEAALRQEVADKQVEYDRELDAIRKKHGQFEHAPLWQMYGVPNENLQAELDGFSAKYAKVQQELAARAQDVKAKMDRARRELDNERKKPPPADKRLKDFEARKKAADEEQAAVEAALQEEGLSLEGLEEAMENLRNAGMVRNAIVRRTDSYLKDIAGAGLYNGTSGDTESSEGRKEDTWAEYQSLEEKIASLKQEIAYYKSHSDEDPDGEKTKAAKKRGKELVQRREEILASMERQAKDKKEEEENIAEMGGESGGETLMYKFLAERRVNYKDELNTLLNSEEYHKYVDYRKESDELERQIEEKQGEAASFEALNPKTWARMYQIALDKDSVLTLDQLMEKGGDLSPLVNGSMKIVSAGILLGNTGMDLKKVRETCRKYFLLRSRERKGGRNAPQIFEDLFGVNPIRIPSDERLKDFHRGWKRIGDARETHRRIVDAVRMEVF